MAPHAPRRSDAPRRSRGAPRGRWSMSGIMNVSAVVPTKDRPALLAETVRALLAQTVVLDELIVVDQSATDAGRRAVQALVDAAPAPRRPALVYVWDRTINGAAAARNAGLDRARGAIVIFCDDDVAPEPVVVERLLAHYARVPDLAGLAGARAPPHLPARAVPRRAPAHLLVLASLSRRRARARADVHRRSHVVPPRRARRAAPRRALPGGLRRRGHRPVLVARRPRRPSRHRHRRTHRAQQGAAAREAAGGSAAHLLGLPLRQARAQDARDAPGLRLVHDGRGAERAPRDGTHPLVGAAQVGVGGCAGRAQRLRGLDVPGPARPRVLTPGGVARYCGAGRRRLSARKPGGSGSIGGSTPRRSEERRVGKECRYRWSPYH